MSKANPTPLCAVCDYPASEPFHDPKYGAHPFQSAKSVFATETGNYTGLTVPRYYVVYSAAGYMDLRYYFYRGEIETAEDIRRVIQCISEAHLVKSPVPVNWKRIS